MDRPPTVTPPLRAELVEGFEAPDALSALEPYVSIGMPDVEMALVSLGDLRKLSSSDGINLGLLGITSGVFVTLAITLSTVTLTDRQLALHGSLTFIALIFSLFFGWNARKEHQRSRGELKRIEETSRKIRGRIKL